MSDIEKIAKKLSPTAADLLRLVDQRTQRDDEGNLKRYFVPSDRVELVRQGRADHTMVEVYVHGASTVAALKSLATKGLTEPKPASPYSYAITETSRLVAEVLYAAVE